MAFPESSSLLRPQHKEGEEKRSLGERGMLGVGGVDRVWGLGGVGFSLRVGGFRGLGVVGGAWGI